MTDRDLAAIVDHVANGLHRNTRRQQTFPPTPPEQFRSAERTKDIKASSYDERVAYHRETIRRPSAAGGRSAKTAGCRGVVENWIRRRYATDCRAVGQPREQSCRARRSVRASLQDAAQFCVNLFSALNLLVAVGGTGAVGSLQTKPVQCRMLYLPRTRLARPSRSRASTFKRLATSINRCLSQASDRRTASPRTLRASRRSFSARLSRMSVSFNERWLAPFPEGRTLASRVQESFLLRRGWRGRN